MSNQLLVNIVNATVPENAVRFPVPHGLRSNGSGVAPTFVLPKAPSPVTVVGSDETNIYLTNSHFDPVQVTFRCARGLSNEVDADKVSPFYASFGSGMPGRIKYIFGDDATPAEGHWATGASISVSDGALVGQAGQAVISAGMQSENYIAGYGIPSSIVVASDGSVIRGFSHKFYTDNGTTPKLAIGGGIFRIEMAIQTTPLVVELVPGMAPLLLSNSLLFLTTQSAIELGANNVAIGSQGSGHRATLFNISNAVITLNSNSISNLVLGAPTRLLKKHSSIELLSFQENPDAQTYWYELSYRY